MAIVFLGTPAFAVPSLRRPPPGGARGPPGGAPGATRPSWRSWRTSAPRPAWAWPTGRSCARRCWTSPPGGSSTSIPPSSPAPAGPRRPPWAKAAAGLRGERLGGGRRGETQPQPQDDSQATKAPLLKKEHGAIDWSLPAVEIWRRVRAYNPWPGAYTRIDGALLHIWEAWALADGGAAP